MLEETLSSSRSAEPSQTPEAATAAFAFAPTASAEERIEALLEIGLSVEELSATIGVAENTIRNWADGSKEPRRAADRVLDDLRTVVLALDEGGVRSSRAVRWLRSRNRAWLHNERPLDILRNDPLLVLAAAEEPQRVKQEPRQKVRSISSGRGAQSGDQADDGQAPAEALAT
jgi:DNA-binding transcriptional regulator YiaG